MTIELPERGVNAVFLVQKVTISLSEAGLWVYTVEYGGRLLGRIKKITAGDGSPTDRLL